MGMGYSKLIDRKEKWGGMRGESEEFNDHIICEKHYLHTLFVLDDQLPSY